MQNLDWLGNKTEKEDFHSFRKKGLGSSDMPILMEVSPWKTIYELWLEKTGLLPESKKFTGNWATERGNRLEPSARNIYNRKFGCQMQVEQAVHPENPVFRVNFDGIDHSLQRVLEIKCPGKEDHQKAVLGQIPDKYYPQLQWLLFLSGYSELDYVSYDGTESDDPTLWANSNIVSIRLNADPAYQTQLKEKATWFWDLVEKKVPPHTDEVVVQSEELLVLLEEYDHKKWEMNRLEKRMDEMKALIQGFTNSSTTLCGDFKISWITRKGNVDYSIVPVLNGFDLEPYRKPEIMALTIKKLVKE